MSIRMCAVLGVVVGGLSAAATGAVVVDLNVPGASLSALTPVVTQRLRFESGGGVDQMLFKQPDPAGYPAADRVRIGGSYNGSVSYLFTVTHTAATRNFAYSLSNGAVSGDATFANPASPNGTISRAFAAGELNYNILHILMVTNNNATASFSSLSLTFGPGVTTTGSLQTSASITGATSTSYDQWFAAPTGANLDDVDWTLTANVTLAMNGSRPSAEQLKFELSAKSGTYVPAPASLGLMVIGGAFAGRRRRG
jgi:hypothetical protein